MDGRQKLRNGHKFNIKIIKRHKSFAHSSGVVVNLLVYFMSSLCCFLFVPGLVKIPQKAIQLWYVLGFHIESMQRNMNRALCSSSDDTVYFYPVS